MARAGRNDHRSREIALLEGREKMVLYHSVPASRRRPRAAGRAGRFAAALLLLALAGCTTTGVGMGVARNGPLHAVFTWTADSATRGTMTAALSNGQTYGGPFFQITRETTVDELNPLWTGWAGRWGWHGWDYWGPEQRFITDYSGKVVANLQGPGGYMRCRFTLMRPSSGMAGGGTGRCQLPDGAIIDADFAPT
jgi:hypothetical protein